MGHRRKPYQAKRTISGVWHDVDADSGRKDRHRNSARQYEKSMASPWPGIFYQDYYPGKKLFLKEKGVKLLLPNPLIYLVSPVGIEPTTY